MSSLPRSLNFIVHQHPELDDDCREQISDLKEALPSYEIRSVELELDEYFGEPEAVIEKRCKAAAVKLGRAVMVEDSALCCVALGGLPGTAAKHYAKRIRASGLCSLLDSFPSKDAVALSLMAYTLGPDRPVHIFKGSVEGTVVQPTSNLNAHSWLACFQPNGASMPLGAMSREERAEWWPKRRCLEAVADFFDDPFTRDARRAQQER